MKRVKTWTVNTYERRTNHALVAPDLLSKTEEFSLDVMHFYMDNLANAYKKYGCDCFYRNYELLVTDTNGKVIIHRPVPATYEEVNG